MWMDVCRIDGLASVWGFGGRSHDCGFKETINLASGWWDLSLFDRSVDYAAENQNEAFHIRTRPAETCRQ
jgi:hypothetical protein